MRARTGSTYEHGVQGSLQRLGVPEVEVNNSQEVTSMASLRVFACAAVAASLLASVASAADRLVPAQYATIQAAITASQAGDVVRVAAGAYPESINFGGKAITVLGTAGSANTYLIAPSSGVSVVTFAASETVAAVLDGFTVYNSLNAPAMRVTSASPTIRNCVFQNCQNGSSQGGALYVSGTSPTPSLTNCQFLGNRAASGGAVALLAGMTTFVNCDFQSNEANAGNSQGGAIYSSAGRMQITDSRFTNNTSRSGDAQGGAVYIGNAVSNFTRCVFSDNSVSGSTVFGGAIREDTSASTYVDCDFIRCTATTGCCSSYGGALFFGSGADPTISGCEFVQCKSLPSNRATYAGAVYYAGGSGGSLSNSLLDGSVATSQGGALLIENGASPIVRDTVIKNSSAAEGGAVYVRDGASPFFLRTAFIDASASSTGGGIHVRDNSNIVIDGCTFLRCTATSQGGAVYTWYAAVILRNNIFQSNTSASGSAIRSNGDTNRWPTLFANNGCGNSGAQANWLVGTWFDAPPYNTNTFAASCGTDCNSNGIADAQEIAAGLALDCNSNAVPDSCDVTSGTSLDCNGNGRPDSCDVTSGIAFDCNTNGVLDACEISSGGVPDCNGNGRPDSCDVALGAPDCNGDGIPDSCQPDCNANGIADVCEVSSTTDCNGNGVPDSCELAAGTLFDRNNDDIPDSCQNLDFTGIVAELKPVVGTVAGLPSTAVCWRIYATFSNPSASVWVMYGNSANPFAISASGGFYQSVSGADLGFFLPCTSSDPTLAYDSFITIGAECQDGTSLGENGFDFSAFASGSVGMEDPSSGAAVFATSAGIAAGADHRVLLMQLTTNTGVKPSAVFSLIGDNASKGTGNEWFAYGMGIPDPILVDCNSNGVHDAIEIASGLARDCNRNGVPDSCDFPTAIANADCDGDGAFDVCEIYAGSEADSNGNWIPDDCECLGDVDGNGAVNVDDLIEIILAWGDPNPGAADLNADGVVNGLDLVLVLQGWGTCI